MGGSILFMPNESELIAKIRQRSHATDDVRVGIGDDAAVIRASGRDLITCCDLMVEGVHFRREWTSAYLLGRKALAVTLSDVAAMGGVARFAMISIALSSGISSEFVDELFRGIFDLSDESDVSIIGGDTSSSPDAIFIDTIAIGQCEPDKAVTRAGAQTDNAIYVTGSLGASAFGLSLLEQGVRLGGEATLLQREALTRHFAPEPRLKFGAEIGQSGLATSMIDISDGLSTDLSHILDESNCGALLRAASIPIGECVRRSTSSEDEALRFALHSGEEYELLFTARPEDDDRIRAVARSIGLPVTLIGEIVLEKGLTIEREGRLEPVDLSGYEHRI